MSKGGSNCVKYTLYLFNVIFFILGVAALGIGIFIQVDEERLSKLVRYGINGLTQDSSSSDFLYDTSILFLVIGSVLIILSFVGCYGALRAVKCFIVVYLCFLALTIVLQLTSLELAVSLHNRVSDSLETSLYTQLNSSYDNFYDSSSTFTRGFDYAMVYFECCGVRNYTEFQNRSLVSKWSHFNSQTIPAHCCKLNRTVYIEQNLIILQNSSCPTTLGQSNIDKPCYDVIDDWLQSRITILIALAALILCVEIVGMVLASIQIACINGDKTPTKPQSVFSS